MVNNKLSLPPQDVLREWFQYSFVEGALYWRKRPSPKARLAHPAGFLDPQGYHTITFQRRPYRRHRLVWAYFNSDPGPLEIDHVNRVKGDDRLENLRVATRRQNSQNLLYSTNKSGVHGVCWHKRDKRWQAAIRRDGVIVHLGYFEDLAEAKSAYALASRESHGEFSVYTEENL